MGRRVLWRHMWGYVVCLCPTKGTPGLNEIIPHQVFSFSYTSLIMLIHRNKQQKDIYITILKKNKTKLKTRQKLITIFDRRFIRTYLHVPNASYMPGTPQDEHTGPFHILMKVFQRNIAKDSEHFLLISPLLYCTCMSVFLHV